MSEKKSETADDRLSFLVDAVKDYAIFLLDKTGHVLSWNVGAERIKGYRSQEIIGKHFSVFYPDEQRFQKHPEHELEIASLEGRYEEEGLRIRKDGSEFWAWVTITALHDASGELTGFAKITRDVTERKLQEQRLLESEERMRLLLEAVKDYALFMVDEDGKIASWNAGAQRMNGYTADEAIGQSLAIFYPEEALARGYPECELEAARSTGHYEEEGIRIRKDGTKYWANVILTSLMDKEGKLRGFAKVTRDITEKKKNEEALMKAHHDLERRVEQRTGELLGVVERLQREVDERKKVEEELIRAKEAAQASNIAKSAFLANMSHEIRTPLGAVLGFSELLLQDDLEFDERELFRETLKRNSNLLLTIINDILDLSKVESGKFEIHRAKVNLNDLLTEIAAAMSLKASEKGLIFTIEAEGSLPQFIETDAVRWKQIIFNVVGNAIKFTEKGRVTMIVSELAPHRGASQIAVDVVDTGPGIEKNNARNLFQPFVQVDASLTRKHGGTGLGLALSRHLAQALGGNVVLSESELGKGSTFTITIDAGDSQRRTVLFESSRTSDPKALQAVASRHPLKPSRILLVEDMLDNRILICNYLKKLGVEVEMAKNGREGVDMASKTDFDAILMDLQMPVMDGFHATAELRKDGYKKPIIAISAHAMKDDEEKSLKAGFDAHLAKPFNEHSLYATLNPLLQ